MCCLPELVGVALASRGVWFNLRQLFCGWGGSVVCDDKVDGFEVLVEPEKRG